MTCRILVYCINGGDRKLGVKCVCSSRCEACYKNSVNLLLIRNGGQKNRSGFLVGCSFKTNSGSHYDYHISYARRWTQHCLDPLTAKACAQWCSRQRCGDRRYGRDLPTGIVQISQGGATHASHAVFMATWSVAPLKPMSGGRSYCVAELRQCQESRRGKKVEVLGGFVWDSASRKEVLTWRNA